MDHVEVVGLTRPPGSDHIGRRRLFALALVVALAWTDGVDLQISSFAASGVGRAWDLGRNQLATFLSAGLWGLLFGSPVFGWLGDRIGRRPVILLSCAGIAAMSIACATADSFATLNVLRAAAGFFLGGLMPNLVALTAETAPPRWRGAAVVLVAAGVGLGATSTAWLLVICPALHGWRALFVFGAAAPACGGLLAAALLPESPAILASRTVRSQDTSAAGTTPPSAAPVAALFRNGLALVTPALWLMAAAIFLTSYLVTSWTPVLMRDSGLSEATSGHAVSLLHTGGTIGAVVAAFLVDRHGWVVIGTYAMLGMAGAAATVAWIDTPAILPWSVGVLGFGVIGAQCGLNAAAGMIYPTTVRSAGTGVVFAASRTGSIAGPYVGGWLLASGVGAPGLYRTTLLPLAVALLVAAGLAFVRGRRFDGAGELR